MTIEEFLKLDRVPTAAEFMSLAESIGLTFRINKDGVPVISYNGSLDSKEEAEALSKLVKREPWRSEILKKLSQEHTREESHTVVEERPPDPPKENRCFWQDDEDAYIEQPEVPPGSTIIVMDEAGRTDSYGKEMGQVTHWSWLGISKGWFDVNYFPVPKEYKGRLEENQKPIAKKRQANGLYFDGAK